jgi:replicative DNA helicase
MTSMPNLPYDLAAEMATLGAILLDREAIIAVAPWLLPAHFYLEKHALVYAAALRVYARREPPDLATVAAELQRRDELELVGGHTALGELVAQVPTALHINYYARTVERTAVGRALIEAAGRVAALGYDDSRNIEERLEEAGQLIFQLSAQRQLGQDFVPLATVAGDYLAAVEAAEDGDLLGLSCGYPELDQITQGLKAGELVVLAARPGVGKTAMALSMALHVAQAGRRVGIFSLEMDRELLMQRLLAMALNVPTTLVPRMIRRGDVRAMDTLAALSELPIHIDHTAALNVLAIRDRARRLAAEAPVDLWIVDYLQLAQSVKERDDEVARITVVSQGLTTMAREFRTPVLALSQLSRAVEGRAGHVPQLSDLRGSGSIEQDASQVWFIYREELYDAETDKTGVAEIHVSKHRNGETGVATLRFERATTRFHSLDAPAPPWPPLKRGERGNGRALSSLAPAHKGRDGE